jgi:hypothetical protein
MVNIIPHDGVNARRTESLTEGLTTLGPVTVLQPMTANRVLVVGA